MRATIGAGIAQSPRLGSWQRAFVLTAFCLPLAVAVAVVSRHAVAVPYWDDWGTPGEQLASFYRGTLTLSELLGQHNEHRRFFPRLVALSVTGVVGWDTRYLIALTFVLLGAGSLALYSLLRRTVQQPAICILAFAAMNLLLFSPREYETLLDASILADLFVPAFAIVAASLLNLSACSLRMKTMVNATLALISTFTFGNGMLVWLLGYPLDTNGTASRAGRVTWRAGYVAVALASIGSYFAGYHHPPLSPQPASILAQPGELFIYVLVWAGNLFLVSRPMMLGAAVLAMFGVLSVAAIRSVSRGGEWRAFYPWVSLGLYAVISGCVTARGRLAFGYDSATHYRYTAVTVFLYIAVVGLAAAFFSQASTARSKLAWRAALVGGAAAFLILWGTTFQQERRRVAEFTAIREHLKLVTRWSLAIPENPELALLSPYETTLGTIRTLAEHGVLRPSVVSDALARAVMQPPAAANAAAGMLEAVTPGAAGDFMISGWARLPDRDVPADCVVVGYETSDGRWKPLTVFETDAKGRFQRTVAGVDAPTGEITFRAWSVNLKSEQAFPMAGACRVR